MVLLLLRLGLLLLLLHCYHGMLLLMLLLLSILLLGLEALLRLLHDPSLGHSNLLLAMLLLWVPTSHSRIDHLLLLLLWVPLRSCCYMLLLLQLRPEVLLLLLGVAADILLNVHAISSACLRQLKALQQRSEGDNGFAERQFLMSQNHDSLLFTHVHISLFTARY